MASRTRIFNIDHNCYYDRAIIALGIENCSITWVEQGVSVRCLTEAEKQRARAEQVASTEEIPLAEIPHTRFKGPLPNKRGLIRAANWMLETTVNWPSKAVVDATLARMEVTCSQ